MRISPARSAFTALALCLLITLQLPTGGRTAAGAGQGGRRGHVVLISIDGFAAFYMDDPRVPLPHIRRLARDGLRAEGMVVANPSVTWPNHTTMVTGAWAAAHRVLANGMIERTGDPPRYTVVPRKTKVELCRVPTVYDLAHAAGLKTAAINWPVTREAPTLTWDMPDHPEPIRYTTPSLLADLKQQGLVGEGTEPAFSALGAVTRDYVWTRATSHLIRRHRPDLTILHLLLADGQQHTHGPQTSEAYTAVALADERVGEVLQAVKDAGLERTATVIVTGDHGFSRYNRILRPNVRLLRAGLIRALPEGRYEFDVQVIAEGGSALVYVAPGQPASTTEKAIQVLSSMDGVEKVVRPAEFDALGLPKPGKDEQAPSLVLSAADGYAFDSGATGEEVTQLPLPRGAHGYLSTNPKMNAAFAARGPHVKAGGSLRQVRSVDIAPTIARLLGLEMKDVDGRPLEAVAGAGRPGSRRQE